MDTHTHHDFTRIIQQAQAVFADITYVTDSTPERAILRLQATYGSYRVFVTELRDTTTRKYRYYVLKDTWVEAGFDNSPDPRALRLKYGRIGHHAGELVPHLHRENKQHLELTDEMNMKDFIQWLREHFSGENT